MPANELLFKSRYRHELAFYKSKVYVLGGGTSIDADGFNLIHAFNVQTRVWELLKTQPGKQHYYIVNVVSCLYTNEALYFFLATLFELLLQ